MPFIFHSNKESIFDRKPQNPATQQNNMLQLMPNEKVSTPSNSSICKSHPFRKLNESQSSFTNFQPQLNKDINRQKADTSKIIKKSTTQPIHSDKQNVSPAVQFKVQNHSSPSSTPTTEPLIKRIHQPSSKTQKSQTIPILPQKYHKQQQRLKFSASQTPGPGYYDCPLDTTTKITQPSKKIPNYPVPSNRQKPFQCSLVSRQKQNPDFSERSFLFDCHYKNQTSPNFRTSILDRKGSTMKKNGSLLSLLFAKKDTDLQSQTTCDSRLNQISKKQSFEQEYIKLQERSPSPCSYNPNPDGSPNIQKKNKVFISGSPKFPLENIRDSTPGPGSYLSEISHQNRQVFRLNQNKRPNDFPTDSYPISPPFAFSSAVPRQLHFDTQKLCQQQFYYSPKNNIIDSIYQKQKLSSQSPKYYFGSTLERYTKDPIYEKDPYKYCFSKQKLSKSPQNCTSLKSTAKRQVFLPLHEHKISPAKYDNQLNSIKKTTQKQIFKKLQKSKYLDEVVLVRQKKAVMQKLLTDEKSKLIDIKSSVKQYQILNPDKYQQFLANMKRMQKQSISFGSNKTSLLKRSLQGRKQLDIYYQTEPGWDIKSFNKYYGYYVQEP